MSFDLEPRQLARANNPATSKAAAVRVREFSSGQHALILAVLHAVDDATAHDIATFCRLTAHEVGKRLNELEKGGAIRVVRVRPASGECELTRATPSGRQARVWEIA